MNSNRYGQVEISEQEAFTALYNKKIENLDGIFLDNDPSIWDSVSLVILKNSIDCVSTQSTINKLAMNIAQGLMMEARINTFKDNEKESFNNFLCALYIF